MLEGHCGYIHMLREVGKVGKRGKVGQQLQGGDVHKTFFKIAKGF